METNRENRRDGALCGMLLAMLLGYVLLHDLLGGTLLSPCSYDSYTLQALAWREGRTWLAQSYPWLELAVFQGRYYVSFPPVPTLVMLPLTFLFGENTPANLVVALYAMGTAALAYKALRHIAMPERDAALFGLFFVWGSNMLWMSASGGVWFQAQGLCMLLLTGALRAAQCSRRIAAYALAALSVGCRPFAAVAFLPLFVFFAAKDRRAGLSLWSSLRKQLPAFLLPCLIAAAMMWYNFIRFGSVLEFGHNYLPEFTEAPLGQFHPAYIGQNLKNILFRFVTLEEGRLSFPYFDGFAFYIANPMFLLLFWQLGKNVCKRPLSPLEGKPARITLLFSMAAMMLLLCAHKTFGGWQFGARYTVDLLPLALGYLLLSCWRPGRGARLIAALGMLFNAYGALAMCFLYA